MVAFVDLSDMELMVLQRALLEARFCEKNRDALVWLSPVLVNLHQSVVELIIDRAQESGRQREVQRWDDWLDWSGHAVERQILAEKIVGEDAWRALPDDDSRVQFLRRILRPFRVSDEESVQTLSLIRDCEATREDRTS